MPTVGWIRETDWDRFSEWSDPTPDPAPVGPLRFGCPFCRLDFAAEAEVQDHLFAAHRGSEPRLLVAGRDPGAVGVLRRMHRAADFTLLSCTAAEIRRNGEAWREIDPGEVPGRLARERDAEVDLRLLNAFDPAAAPIERRYTLRARVPDSAALRAVDAAFVRYLGREDIGMDDVSRFLEAPGTHRGSARHYAEALAAYVRGVLVKDRDPADRITLPMQEYRGLYGQAVEELRWHPRPLAKLVCGVVRFSRSEFADGWRPTLFLALDRVAATLVRALGGDPLPVPEEAGTSGRRAVCPVDQGQGRVIALAERLDAARRWGAALEEECRQAASALTLDAADRAKVLALWAIAAARLHEPRAAREPLADLAGTYPFADWAVRELEGLPG